MCWKIQLRAGARSIELDRKDKQALNFDSTYAGPKAKLTGFQS